MILSVDFIEEMLSEVKKKEAIAFAKWLREIIIYKDESKTVLDPKITAGNTESLYNQFKNLQNGNAKRNTRRNNF